MGTLLLAIDVDSKKTLWKKELSPAINSRALCMDAGRLYYHAPPDRVVALDAKSGNEIWTNNDGDLNKNVLAARSAGFIRFFPFESSLSVTDNILYLCGRTAKNVVAMAADTGALLWHHAVKGQRPHLLVRGREAFFLDNGVCTVLDVAGGKPLRTFPFLVAGCSRVTANQELAFAWYTPGTSFLNLKTGEKGVFKPIRPGCTEGVVTANGMLHWGPWHCGCIVETYGSIGLAPARSTGFDSPKSRLEKPARAASASAGKKADAKDWSAYRADNAGSAYLPVRLSFAPSLKWDYKCSGTPTAPVAAGGRVLVGDSSGVIHSLDEKSGALKHKSYTGGRIYFPPAIREGRYYCGSSDGWIYCHDLGSGSMVWRFRAAPKERRIMSFGKISSTWPVRGNVLIHDGILYAAAGAHDYDGTYLYALDADKGDLKWRTDASSGKRRVHLMGHLLAHKDVIYVASGYETHLAGYEMSTGKPVESKMPAMKTLGAILSSSPSRWHSLEGGRDLYVLDDAVYAWGRSLEIPQELLDSYFGGIAGSDRHVIARESRAGARSPQQITCRLREKAHGKGNKLLWQATIKDGRQIEGLALTANAALAVYSGPGSSGGGILMIDVSNGKIVWEKKFEAAVVPWGIAVSRNGSIILSLADNRVLCFDAGS